MTNLDKRNEMKESTKLVAENAIKNTKSACDYFGFEVNKEALKCEIALLMSELRFESNSAYFMFETSVLREVLIADSELYRKCYPLLMMDENGEYTNNPNNWA